jgi:hypothetical protein
VHRHSGKQRIVMTDQHVIRLARNEKANCLGADNAAGVWMLREMILSGVPGLYVFHRKEESGGDGSRYFAKNNRELFKSCQAAIAFDRRGTRSIITHQFAGMTASRNFATTLAGLIGMDHEPDDGGTFTDTASYSDLISECSNISVGFFNEHSATESLDVPYLIELRNAMVEINPEDIVCERDPGDHGYSRYWGASEYYSGYGSSSGYSTGYSNYGHRSSYSVTSRGTAKADSYYSRWDDEEDDEDEAFREPLTTGADYQRLVDLCKKYPEEVADYLESSGCGPEDVEDHIWNSLGYGKSAEG